MSKQRPVLFKGGAVLTMDAATPSRAVGDVLVDEDRIVAVAAQVSAQDAEVVDAAGMVVLPGFVDAHHRVRLDAGAAASSAELNARTRLAALGCLDSGITTIVNVCPLADGVEHAAASLDALDAVGIRALHVVRPARGCIDAKLVRLATEWNVEGTLVRVGLLAQLDVEAWRAARALDMNILIAVDGDLGLLERAHLAGDTLGPRHLFHRCARIPRATWRALAQARVGVSIGDAALAHVAEPDSAYRQAVEHGLTPGLGVEGSSAQWLAAVHALARVALPADEVLRMATCNGAGAAGLAGTVGSLTPGKQADIVMLRASPTETGSLADSAAGILQRVGPSAVDTVMVAGEFRKRRGALVGVDAQRLRREIEAVEQAC